MPSWTNTTGAASSVAPRSAGENGVLRPGVTTRTASLRREYPVSARLQPYVERYWSVSWSLRGEPPFRAEVLSHPAVNVSVESGDDPRFGVRLPAVLVHGPVTRRFIVDLTNAGRVSAVKFRPGGWTAFTSRPTRRDTIGRLRDELPLDPESLLAAVLAVDDDDGRAAVLDAGLAPHAPEPAPTYVTLQSVLATLDDRALVKVEHVAARNELSVRALQRLFSRYIGLSPKAVLARYRLQDAIAALDAGETDLAGLAYSLGWCDQAHFSRDFRAVVGTTPTAYLRVARYDKPPVPS